MKRNLLITVTICLICLNFIGCTKRPTETDIIDLVKKKYSSDLVIGVDIKKEGKSQKINDTKVYAYTVVINYIRAGLKTGYVSGCPERFCCKDTDNSQEMEYLIGKNAWGEWEVYESRGIEYREIGEYWRPASIPLKEFYSDRISN